MSRHDSHVPSAEMRRELDAIEAALSGEAVADAHAPLAVLARALQATRPRPREEFVRALDAHATRGFRSVGTRARARRSRVGPARRRARLRGRVPWASLSRPALGVALAALLAVAVAVPLSLSGGSRAHVSGPGVRAPAVVQAAPSEGAGRVGSAAPAARAPATRSNAVPAGAAQPESAAAGTSARQLERTATLDIGVAPGAIQSTSQRVFTLVSAFGGYVRQSNVSSGDSAQGGATFDLRVPSGNLAAAISALSRLGHVRSENDTTNDVTDQFDALRRSLAALEAERASLLKQLAAASEAQQAERLKARLRAVDGRISSLRGSLRALSARVNYTSLDLSLTPEASAGAAVGDLTPGGAARDAARVLAAALSVIVLGVAALLPLGVLLAAAWMIIAITRRRLREQALDTS